MRYFISIFCVLFTFSSLNSQWEEIEPWFEPVDGTFSFAIDGKAYVGGGIGVGVRDDFGVFDPQTETWTKLGKLPFGPRAWAFAFAANGKGYVGGGDNKGNLTGVQEDFWEYDPSTDTWTQKSDYLGGKRDGCFSFSINGKGYVGGGFEGQYIVFDAYEYDPKTDKWNEITGLPEAMIFPAHFVIEGKGYVGLPGKGFDNQGTSLYEFDPVTKEWTQKSNFPGEARQATAAFVYNGKAYIGGGQSNYNKNYQDVFSYDPKSNKWNEENEMSLPYNNTGWPIAFNLNDTGYFGLGVFLADFNFTNKFYKWDFVDKPKISISETSLNFGEVKVGETVNSAFDLMNTGKEKLIVENITIDNTVFITNTNTPFELSPGEVVTVEVEFSPNNEEDYNGTLTIISNAASTGTKISLFGIGFQSKPNIIVSEETIDMGNTKMNNDLTHILTITNTGSGELEISEAHIKEIDKGFSIPDMTYPLMIKASESLEIDISFEHSEPGFYETELIIGTNVEGKETILIPLTAEVENNISPVENIEEVDLKFDVYQENNSLIIDIDSEKHIGNKILLYITDINGKILKQFEYEKVNGDLTNEVQMVEFNSGLYLISLLIDEKLIVKKLNFLK